MKPFVVRFLLIALGIASFLLVIPSGSLNAAGVTINTREGSRINPNQPVASSPVTVTSANDSGAGTLRQAIADVDDGGTILLRNCLALPRCGPATGIP